MSYFMVTQGKRPDFSEIPGVEPRPIARAMEIQKFLREIIQDLTGDGDQSDLYLVWDGSHTSSEIVDEIEIPICMKKIRDPDSLASTRLGRVIDACTAAGNSFRIWHFDHQAHLKVKWCNTVDLLKTTIIEQFRRGQNISVGYAPEI